MGQVGADHHLPLSSFFFPVTHGAYSNSMFLHKKVLLFLFPWHTVLPRIEVPRTTELHCYGWSESSRVVIPCTKLSEHFGD